MFLAIDELVDPKQTALLVVDIQNDFCHPQGGYAKEGWDMGIIQGMMANLQAFIEEVRRQRVPILYFKTTHSAWTDSPSWTQVHRYVREGSWGADFYLLKPRPDERVIIKHRYSAFVGTDLDLILRSMGTRTVIMTGVGTAVCVALTAFDGYQRDYNIVFLSDCTGAYTREDHENTLEMIARLYGVVATSEEVVRVWGSLERK